MHITPDIAVIMRMQVSHARVSFALKVVNKVLVVHGQWRFYEGRGGAGALPNLLCPTPWYYAWTIQNFINVLIFRVRPGTYYVKRTMKRQKSIYSKFV